MKFRSAVAATFLLCTLLAGSSANAQEEPIYDESITQGCVGWKACYRACRDNLSRNRDMCDILSWVGWGNYCEIQAANEYRQCTDACYIDCQIH